MKKKTNTTIYDIAKELKVSASTVSRALRNRPDISKELIEKVKQVAKKLNYKPNTIAQSLKERKTKVIGVLLPEITSYTYMMMLSGIEEIAFRKGYHVIITRTNESYQREVMNIESLVGQVDGIIICISQETRKFDHLKRVKQQEIPLVFLERISDKIAGHKVVMNSESLAYMLTEHLIKAGYGQIAIQTGNEHMSINRNSINGYKKALSHYGIELRHSLIVNNGINFFEGRLGFQKLMQQQEPPDAILATSEQIGLAVFAEAKKMHINIPEQMGLAVLSGSTLLALLHPSLTGIGQKEFEMGNMAAQLCINEIEREGPAGRSRTEIFSSDLVIRKSTIKSIENPIIHSYSQYAKGQSGEDSLVHIY